MSLLKTIVLNKKTVAVVAGFSFVLAYEFSSIYVPDDIDEKLSYKLKYLSELLRSKISRIGGFLRLSTEIKCLREISKLINFSPNSRKAPGNNSNVKITNTKSNNIPVRIYTPNSQTNRLLPIMFYYHGGGYCMGGLDSYNNLLTLIVDKLQLIVVSVDYRLGPEYPFPLPIEDCFSATDYLLNNLDEFGLNADLNNIILSGDSAGGNAAAVLSNRFNRIGKNKIQIQALIYPPTQYFNFLLPSSIKYSSIEQWTPRAKMALWHMGLKHINEEHQDYLIKNYHILLIEDEQLKRKLESCLDLSLIPNEYKESRDYYKSYESLKKYVYPTDKDQIKSSLKNDENFHKLLENLFDERFSPGLVDETQLTNQPKTLIIVCENDTRKDESIIYAERLRKAGNLVSLKYYKNGFHGVITWGGKVAQKMQQDIIEFIQINLNN